MDVIEFVGLLVCYGSFDSVWRVWVFGDDVGFYEECGCLFVYRVEIIVDEKIKWVCGDGVLCDLRMLSFKMDKKENFGVVEVLRVVEREVVSFGSKVDVFEVLEYVEKEIWRGSLKLLW